MAIARWRKSFCGEAIHKTKDLAIATDSEGIVIGGGDWASERIIPDAIRCLVSGQPIGVRQTLATRTRAIEGVITFGRTPFKRM